ncbi:VWA domain-containing protein [candidate division WOR-3 bacterium]|nr:VWA domain-containing protein [candidate division WOR-3 bacterium]
MVLHNPIYLLLLLLIPLLYYLSIKRGIKSFVFSDHSPFYRKKRRLLREMPIYLLLLSYAFAVLGLSRPQKGIIKEEIDKKGIDIVIALDISSSMLAEDFQPQNRISIAKKVANEFIDKRRGDRIGLVVFSKEALLQSPLTLDHNVIKKLIDRVNTGMLPDGTAIGMGISTGLLLFENSKVKSKIMILLTDGRNNAGKISPSAAADMAKEMGVKIYTIGIGKKGEVPYPISQGGIKRYVMAKFDIDDVGLTKIADKTGGKYFLASSPEMLKNVMDEINRLEPTTFKVIRYRNFAEKMNIFLVPAILILALFFIEPIITGRLP